MSATGGAHRRPVTYILPLPMEGLKHRQAIRLNLLLLGSTMLLHKTKLPVLRASLALAVPFWIAACGGGGSPPARLFTNFQAASVAVGQPNLESGEANQGQPPGVGTLNVPVGIAVTPQGGMLVADYRNNRVLFYASLAASGTGAVGVLGQPGFGSSAASTERAGMNGPEGVAVGAGMMAVAEYGSNRVLIYDKVPAPGEPMPEPAAVIGQPDFQSSQPSCGPRGLFQPRGVAITSGGKLIVADTQNNRLLVWNSIPAAGTFATPPDLVLGQGDLDHCAFRDENQDGVSDRENDSITRRGSARMMQPQDIWTDGTRLAVVDTLSSRVLIWNTFPTVNFQPADLVLGHPTFSGTGFNDAPDDSRVKPTAQTLGEPQGIHSDGVSLAVADTVNNRVLIWNAFPQASYQSPDVVLGQPDFVGAATKDENGDGLIDPPAAINAQVLHRPTRVHLTPDSLIVSDTGLHRIVVFRR